MYKFPNLKECRILVTNDDGYNAPGIKILERVAKSLTKDVWVVAPETEKSGAGHSLTLSEPLRLRKVSARKFAVKGTPTDCVMMAINKVLQDRRPDLILSGVNRGGNMAEDVTYSGTVAACMEGVLFDIPAIALSQSFANRKILHFPTAEKYAAGVIKKLVATGWQKNVLINVNFPDVPPNQVKGIEVVRQGLRDFSSLNIEERVDARERTYYWIGFRPAEGEPKRNTDLGATAQGYIAITPLHMDLTADRALKRLQAAF